MTAAVSDQQLTAVGAVVYNSYVERQFSAHTATHAVNTLKRREHNFILRSGKSEVEVIENCTRRIVLLKRSLSATAELPVIVNDSSVSNGS